MSNNAKSRLYFGSTYITFCHSCALMIFPNTGASLWYFIILEAILQIISQCHVTLLYEYVFFIRVSLFYFILLESYLIPMLCRNCSCEDDQPIISRWSRSMCFSALLITPLRSRHLLHYVIYLSLFPVSEATTASFNLLSKMSRKVPGTH